MGKKPLIIYGAGGLGRELKAWVERIQEYEFMGFIDDNHRAGSRVDGAEVLGDHTSIAKLPKGINVLIGIGDPRSKMKVMNTFAQMNGLEFPVLIHPKAILDDRDTIKIGGGSVITAGCVLTTGITIGEHVLLNLNCTVGHDCVIGDNTSIMPGVNLSGGVKVGKNVLLGAGAIILNGVVIGDHTRVGAGTVVLKDLPGNCTAVGVPAKIIKA